MEPDDAQKKFSSTKNQPIRVWKLSIGANTVVFKLCFGYIVGEVWIFRETAAVFLETKGADVIFKYFHHAHDWIKF